jgi:hypothetical protein
MKEFFTKQQDEHATIINGFLPNARAFASKTYKESNLYKFILGIAKSFKDVDDLFAKDWQNLNILTIEDISYIELWESSLGIPDLVFKQTEELPIEKRKQQIITKLTSLGAMTKEDMLYLANLLGLEVQIKTGTEIAYPPYDVPFTPVGEGEKFILSIFSKDFSEAGYPPYDVPFTPTGTEKLLIDLFKSIKPANTLLIVN